MIPLALVAITAAVYLPTLGYGFVYDDQPQIVATRGRLHWSALPAYFKNDVWAPISFIRTNYYRPLFLTWLMVNYQLFGLNTVLWHASTVACHLIATLLFYVLARRVTNDPLVAGCAALLFGVHPAHVEAVAWVSGVTEPLFAVLALGTILCHGLEGRLWRVAALVLFAGALFSKETAAVLPLVIGVYEWFFGRHAKGNLRKAIIAVIPYVAITVAYLLIRVLVLGTLAPVQNEWPSGAGLRTLPFAIWFYLRQLVLPLQYSIFHPSAPVTDFGLTKFVLPLIAAAIAAAGLVWIWLRSRAAAFGVALLMAPLLPVLNVETFSKYDYLHDRYLYLPSAGFCLLVALGLKQVAPRIPVRAGVAAALAGVLSVITIVASASWKDENALFDRAVRVAPESPMALLYWGKTLLHEKRYQEALAPLNKAVFLDLENYALAYLLAECYYGMGQLDQATAYVRDAIRLQPRYSDSYVSLAMIEASRGRLPDAEAHLRQALRLRPAPSGLYDRYHFRLGQVLEAEGNLNEALSEYQAELAENPEADDVRDRVQILRRRI